MYKKMLRAATSKTCTIIAVGDVYLGGPVRQVIDKSSEFVFEAIKPWFTGVDFRFANTECCFFRTGDIPPARRVDMSAPEEALPVLSSLFNVVSIANNHTCDYGKDHFLKSREILNEHLIATIGGGRNQKEAEQATIISKHGISVGWLAYADWAFGGAVCNASGRRTPGVAILSPRRVMKAVKALRYHVDVVVVSLHTDMEFADHPDPVRFRFCRALAEAGADVILCHHPHVPQGIEVHNGSVIVYSLGNCVFPVRGNEYMEGNSPHTKHSFAIRIVVDRQGPTEYELLPFEIDENHRPVPLTGLLGEQLLAHLTALSGQLNDGQAVLQAWLALSRRFVLDYGKGLYYSLRGGRIRPLAQFLRSLPHRTFRRPVIGFICSCFTKLPRAC